MESKNKNVVPIGRNDRDALAKEVGMTEFEVSSASPRREELSPLQRRMVAAVAGAATVGGAMWLTAPRAHEAPQPEPKNFAEQVAESAHQPYNPATDELVFKGVRVKAGNPNRDTPSEAFLNDSRVKDFEKAHPNEVSSITTSAMNLPGSGEAALVMRDVDHDGDKDAIAVEMDDKPLIQIEDQTIR